MADVLDFAFWLKIIQSESVCEKRGVVPGGMLRL